MDIANHAVDRSIAQTITPWRRRSRTIDRAALILIEKAGWTTTSQGAFECCRLPVWRKEDGTHWMDKLSNLPGGLCPTTTLTNGALRRWTFAAERVTRDGEARALSDASAPVSGARRSVCGVFWARSCVFHTVRQSNSTRTRARTRTVSNRGRISKLRGKSSFTFHCQTVESTKYHSIINTVPGTRTLFFGGCSGVEPSRAKQEHALQ